MKRAILSLVIFLLISLIAYSQAGNLSLKGTVKDISDKPIQYAQIIAKSTSDSVIINFTFSDEEGLFEVQLGSFRQNSSVIIEARSLGYNPLSLRIESENFREKLNFVLTETLMQLDEVVIEANKPIRSSNDTLIFRLESFIDGTEEVTEDVLKKIPGITITSEGVIKYNGREIRKILLDGDDLTDSNYKILSKNLSADLLQEVEILKNYTDNRLFKGIENTEDVAINLKIKEGRKAPLFGEADVNIGITNVYSLESNLLSYSSHFKGLLLLDLNNIGDNALDSDLSRFNAGNLEYREFKLSSRIIDSDISNPDFLPLNTILFHKSKYSSFNFLVKPSERIKVRNLLAVYSNEISFNSSNILEFNTPEFIVSIEEEIQNEIRPRQIFHDVLATYEINKSSDLQFRSQLTYSLDKKFGQNVLNGQTILDSLTQQDLSGLIEVSLTKRLTKKVGMITRTTYSRDNISENYNLDSLNLVFSASRLNQVTEQTSNNFGVSNTLRAVLGNYNLDVNNGVVWSDQKISNVISSPDDNNFNSENGFRFTAESVFSELIIKREFKHLDFSFGGRYRIEEFHYNVTRKQSFFEPILGLKLRLSQNLKTGIVYNTENRLPGVKDLYAFPIITSFRVSRSNDIPITFIGKTKTLAHFWKYEENARLYISSNLSLYLSKQTPYLSYEGVLQNSGIFEVKAVAISDRSVSSVVYDFSKYLPRLSSTFKLGYEWGQTKASYMLNNELLSSQIDIYRIKASVGTAFSGKLNFGGFIRIDNNISKSEQFYNSLRVTSLSEKITFMASNSLRATFGAEHIHYSSNEYRSGTFLNFANVSLRYTLSRSSLIIGFDLNNLINMRSADVIAIDELSRSTTSYNLLPRYLLLHLKFKF
ncbi:MAG: hypothetical protein COW03_15070 [Cytophagales bacterium CG12_big_fil_rev_8_21_14_0_65_40_12]|nr:MAG: hypothetical protein COW03_15070 [Cytophagales bacterium CG12_big_fil_rev_8_21_14_0_65_40_12]PIW05177.1 MAG: hypothetical protein COW40_05870 [Cytophagales bacterium CG17_big_fil_post_rev_8_21_14_2_50_40_13]